MTESEDNVKHLGHQDNLPESDFLIDMPGKQDKVTIESMPRKKVRIEKYDNNSGMGEQAPYSISKKFNWGAFLFNWIWGIKYKKWALLAVPIAAVFPYGIIISVIISLWAGAHGNQWAWEEIEYANEEDFHKAQQYWVKAWGVFATCVTLIFSPLLVQYIKQPEEAEISIQDHQLLSSLELSIPKEYFEQTDNSDNHASFINSNKHIIYWLRPDNENSTRNREFIETRYAKAKDKLKDKFILYPDIKGLKDQTAKFKSLELEAKCKNDVCIDTWLYKKCNRGYCIINPKTKKYYKVRTKEGVIPKALYLRDKWY